MEKRNIQSMVGPMILMLYKVLPISGPEVKQALPIAGHCCSCSVPLLDLRLDVGVAGCFGVGLRGCLFPSRQW